MNNAVNPNFKYAVDTLVVAIFNPGMAQAVFNGILTICVGVLAYLKFQTKKQLASIETKVDGHAAMLEEEKENRTNVVTEATLVASQVAASAALTATQVHSAEKDDLRAENDDLRRQLAKATTKP